MPKRKKVTPELRLADPQLYFNQELSWLDFNSRVLQNAIDPRTPLLERLRLIATFSSNLDEFFMVRVAALKQQVEAQVSQHSPDGLTPLEQLRVIAQRLQPVLSHCQQYFEQSLHPQLAAKGIYLLNYAELNPDQQLYLQGHFEKQILPVLTPVVLGQSRAFPNISNLSLNLAVTVKNMETGVREFVGVQLPAVLSRFIALPRSLWYRRKGRLTVWTGLPLEQVIAHNLAALFPGMKIMGYSLFRVTRNTDLELVEEEADDLLLAIEQELRNRNRGGVAVRLEVQASMPRNLRKTLMQELDLCERDVYDLEGLMGLSDLMSLASLPIPRLKNLHWAPLTPAPLQKVKGLNPEESVTKNRHREDIFSVIRRQDILLHHPYHSFSTSVQLFVAQAAIDPDVLAIKMTLYRTAGDSSIVTSLIVAAENGKQVAVLIELKARFDEENNIQWARKLESAGVHVVYGVVGLKTHTKVTLVVRREMSSGASPHEIIRRYVHIGTGNYNHRTARTYTDLGLLSCRESLGADLTDLFNSLTGYSHRQTYRQLLVAPFDLRDRLVSLIRREIEHSKRGRHGRIVAKMNALVDPQMIQTLYQASQAGVKIDLVVRGTCCLRPGIPGISENIRVISIIGRFHEHSRICYFHNDGKEEIYIGSADWMPRNLDRRVEVVVPLEDPSLVKEVAAMLGIMLADNRRVWELQADGQYIRRRPRSQPTEQDSQAIFMQAAIQSLELK
ncbi:MAG: polyphosphate kinase 1 [Drouetiella hepatica Uher 2000/2452]|jgi:polyphosphate kinase|uniref:Polyphosphate kinase n=1 Tax=Drouetiella hepatica Uher 2000/2452 TaxID=904376 RepID=A0A951UKX9_9CYAN|nr:polyphosphate kinase 1 [Drouetiella hepatica Uher 2000/2452]